MFKIFYSWQSDLPGNKTKNFIRNCIDEAITLAQDSEAIEAVRDEGTLGTTGSPDIVSTLFSKIDECDLFIADVSLCYTEDEKKEKRSPNPNVLLELGYAVKTLTWDRVICLVNTDFGDDFPFDFNHNRRSKYSLEGNNRKEEQNRMSNIIFSNIRDLRNAPPRAKNGIAVHLLGSYDRRQKNVSSELAPLILEHQESYVLHNQELIEESKALVETIRNIIIVSTDVDTEINSENNQLNTFSPLLVGSIVPVNINIEEEREKIKIWLNIDTDDVFFDCGNLRKKKGIFGGSEEYIGTPEEKQKYEYLTELFYRLTQLEMRSQYVKTFKDLIYVPLAIQNMSQIEDQNIRIVVRIDGGEGVDPDKNLICDELNGNQGLICRYENENSGVGLIDELFILPEDGNIHIEESAFTLSTYRINTPVFVGGHLQYPGKDEKDYEDELREYIASLSGRDYYEFEIKSLRPSECKWLSHGLLIRPEGDSRIKLQYSIKSTYSTGDLSGELEIQWSSPENI